MDNPIKVLGRPVKRMMQRWLHHFPTLRRPGVFSDADLRAVGETERLLFPALAANVNRNDRALYDLVHVHRLLRKMCAAVGLDLRGQDVLEMGASPEPGLPFILLLEGTRRVIANNIFPLTDRLDEAYARTLLLFLLALRDADPLRFDAIAEWVGSGEERSARLRPECFVPLGSVGAEVLDLPDGSVDVVFSMAVLEHVDRPAEVVAKCYALLRPGGWCLHAVDLRDHRDFSRPLEFLKLTPEQYRAATGDSENRVRAGEWLDLFRAAGFEIAAARFQDVPLQLNERGSSDLVDMASWPLEKFFPAGSLEEVRPWVSDQERAGFAAPFRDMDPRDLSVLGLLVIGRKPLP